jgi:hypothetical protein
MREGKLKIGDEAYALELLANVHGTDPRRPVRELVENGADSDASSILVVINKRATEPYIMCRDNGKGMTLKLLLDLPENICNSIKRRERMKTGGVHGIGLLSYNTIGNRLRIISRARGSADTSAIEFTGLNKPWHQIEVERPLEEPGTEVYIYGIEKDKKLLDAERLAEYLAEEFEEDLIEGKFKLGIQQDGRKIPVTRERIIAGTPIVPGKKIPTEWGDINVAINYGGRGGVALTRRGITITNNIASLPDIESDVWKSGKIGGSIKFDSINVSTDKKNPIRDERFNALIAAIKALEPEIAEAIKKLEQDEIEKSRERLLKYLASRLDEVLKGLHFDRIKALMEARKKAELEAEVSSTEGTAFGGEGGSSKEKEGKTPVSKGTRKRSLKSVYGINWEEVSDLEHPKSRSRFDAKFGTVYINRVHPDFTRKVLNAKNDFEKLDYYYKLTIKEIVLHQYDGAPPSDVLEKLLDLQLAMEKSPPSL